MSKATLSEVLAYEAGFDSGKLLAEKDRKRIDFVHRYKLDIWCDERKEFPQVWMVCRYQDVEWENNILSAKSWRKAVDKAMKEWGKK